ncbi:MULTISPECIES: MFS transporter [Paenibacillus]|jgi:MFS transporter, DHA1 family, tetracycline resistance protein|uniref:MFS transporter n=1 Tax=Paenibacillus TaxID=44249 RepID=UPI0004F5D5C5|nr:MFS transporter [Paenibacillus sp. FSL R5-0912]AIQ41322.1 MFS transporter [Paenibacillus sp. FSL R5-0912]
MAKPLFPRLQGNSRGCLTFEPFFLIPYSMFSTYATLYMYELGLSELNIGWITTIGLIVQVFSSLISGYLTDRLGRKRAILYFDLLSWSLATLLWAFSHNLWFFVAAAVINGFQRVPHIAFYCLIVEDTRPSDRTYVFTLLQIIGVIGGLFAPLGGLLVHQYGMIQGMRMMYVLAFLFMTFQFVGRQLTTRETEAGIRKRQETRELGLREIMVEYGGAFRELWVERNLLLIFGVYILFNFQATLKSTYLSLYLADYLHMDSGILSLFPAVSSIIMLLTLWLLMPKIPDQSANRSMMAGFGLSALSNAMLVLYPSSSLLWIGLSTILAAVGLMISSPYLEAAVQNAIDDDKRAKVFSTLSVLILLFTAPAGIIGGWAYKLDPRIPLWLVTAAFVLSYALLHLYRRRTAQNHNSPQQLSQ